MRALLCAGTDVSFDVGRRALVDATLRDLHACAPSLSIEVADGPSPDPRGFDAAIWGGGCEFSTGLDAGLAFLERANRCGVPSFVWGVGMDARFLSASLSPSAPARFLSRLAGVETLVLNRRRARLEDRFVRALSLCRGVWVRDLASLAHVTRLGFASARLSAPPLLTLASAYVRPGERVPPSAPCVGLSLSAASAGPGVRRFVERLAAAGLRVVGLPLRPEEDAPRLAACGVREMLGRSREQALPGFSACGVAACAQPYGPSWRPETSPEAFAAFLERCDVVFSDRLEALALATHAGTPVMATGRGTETADWLQMFGFAPEDAGGAVDWDASAARAAAFAGDAPRRAAFVARRDGVYRTMLGWRAAAASTFAATLAAAMEK